MEENIIEEIQKPETHMRERRLWFFTCTVCGKNRRRSHKKARAKEGMCLSCFRSTPNPNQPNLFSPMEESPPEHEAACGCEEHAVPFKASAHPLRICPACHHLVGNPKCETCQNQPKQ